MGYSRTEVLGGMQKGKSRAKRVYHEVHNKGGTGDKTAGPKVAGGLDGLQGVPVVERRFEGAPYRIGGGRRSGKMITDVTV